MHGRVIATPHLVVPIRAGAVVITTPTRMAVTTMPMTMVPLTTTMVQVAQLTLLLVGHRPARESSPTLSIRIHIIFD